jgi:dinuclear metal center YbgI/SA1388 family protein
MRIQNVVNVMNEIAPPELACSAWDKTIGLQLGNADTSLRKVLVTLDISASAINKAVKEKAGLIVAHHSLFHDPLVRLDTNWPLARKLKVLLAHNIGVFIAHTNLDAAGYGVNYWLARREGLIPEKCEVLEPTYTEELYKLTVFVPKMHADKVRETISQAGAGHVGNYSHCTFNISGTGTFKPLKGTSPYIGQQGKLEKADEIRIETIVPELIKDKVVNAMLNVHPYEEVAYDLYKLENRGRRYGLGLIGDLSKSKLIMGKKVKRLAVCGGNGGSLIYQAYEKGAQAFITGECNYHDNLLAEELGMSLIKKGHFETENIIVRPLAKELQKRLPKLKILTY